MAQKRCLGICTPGFSQYPLSQYAGRRLAWSTPACGARGAPTLGETDGRPPAAAHTACAPERTSPRV
eukprot:14734347-Heterocapsa_arctica.AAC.1